MVLETLITSKKAERRPYEMFLIGAVYTTIAIFLSVWIFERYASLVMVFLTVIASVYLMQNTLRLEEKKDAEIKEERILLKEHSKALLYFMFLFLGSVFAFSLWYIILPAEMVQNLFSTQIETIEAVNRIGGQITGNALLSAQFMGHILLNNLKVLFFSILFAFFYGAGALFILIWNASVVGAAIGSFVRTNLAVVAKEVGFMSISNYFSTYSLGLLRYLTHGIFEILAYFTAALGAGIISIAVIREELGSERFKHILIDSIDLILISILLIVIAAFIEVFITPILF